MKGIVVRKVFLTGLGTAMFVGTAIPSEAAARTVTFENKLGVDTKVCVKPTGKGNWLTSKRCWKLKHKQSTKWNRGRDTSKFDIRVYEDRLVDKKICGVIGVRDVTKVAFNSINNCFKFTYAKTPTPSDGVDAKKWKNGDKVIVSRKGEGFWYPGKIMRPGQRLNRVKFATGGEDEVDHHYIVADTIRLMTRVQGNFQGKGRWYNGTIARRTGNLVQIVYDDGEREETTLGNIRLKLGDLPKPPKQYKLRICNKNSRSVFFALGFVSSADRRASEGWWQIAPDACRDFPLTQRLERIGVNPGEQAGVFLYAETEPNASGKRDYWHGKGKSGELRRCLKEDRTANFKVTTKPGETEACDQPGYTMLPMRILDMPDQGSSWYAFTFGEG